MGRKRLSDGMSQQSLGAVWNDEQSNPAMSRCEPTNLFGYPTVEIPCRPVPKERLRIRTGRSLRRFGSAAHEIADDWCGRQALGSK